MRTLEVPGIGNVTTDGKTLNGQPIEFGNVEQIKILRKIEELDKKCKNKAHFKYRSEYVEFAECSNCGMDSDACGSAREAEDQISQEYGDKTICRSCGFEIN